MIEWILIISMHMSGKLDSYAVEAIDGFRTEESCLKAGEAIASQFAGQYLDHLAAAGLDVSTGEQRPLVFHDCKEISK